VFEDKDLADETVKAVEKQIQHAEADDAGDGVTGKAETTTTERAV
jgi:hypothetical protein